VLNFAVINREKNRNLPMCEICCYTILRNLNFQHSIHYWSDFGWKLLTRRCMYLFEDLVQHFFIRAKAFSAIKRVSYQFAGEKLFSDGYPDIFAWVPDIRCFSIAKNRCLFVACITTTTAAGVVYAGAYICCVSVRRCQRLRPGTGRGTWEGSQSKKRKCHCRTHPRSNLWQYVSSCVFRFLAFVHPKPQ